MKYNPFDSFDCNWSQYFKPKKKKVKNGKNKTLKPRKAKSSR